MRCAAIDRGNGRSRLGEAVKGKDMGLTTESAERIAHAHRVERALQALGWLVAVIGVIGALVFGVFWILGDLSAEQAVSLILGTTLATILSGASAYGAGVNVGLGADRLAIALVGHEHALDEPRPDLPDEESTQSE